MTHDPDKGMVDATQARDRILTWRARGHTWVAIAETCDLWHTTVIGVAQTNPRQQVRRAVHNKIMAAVDPAPSESQQTFVRMFTGSPSWMQLAECKGLDPDLFFPERGESTDEAKAVCATCAVRVECHEYAVVERERDGIWGGTSAIQRKRARSAKAS